MITTAAHTKMKNWLLGLLSHGTYTNNGVTSTMPIQSINLVGDVITVQFYLDDSVSGTITKFQVIDKDGGVFDDQPDSIAKPNLNGLLITFKYTLKKI